MNSIPCTDPEAQRLSLLARSASRAHFTNRTAARHCKERGDLLKADAFLDNAIEAACMVEIHETHLNERLVELGYRSGDIVNVAGSLWQIIDGAYLVRFKGTSLASLGVPTCASEALDAALMA